MQDGSHPIGEGFDGLVSGRDGGCIDRDEVWLGAGAAGSIFSGVAVHEAVFALFDPFDGTVQSVADWDTEVGEVHILDVPFWSCFERVLIFLDPVGEPLDLRVKGISGAEVLLSMGFEGVDKAATYDSKH